MFSPAMRDNRRMLSLHLVLARTVVGDLPVEVIPDWAAQAIAEGLDSVSLRELAGMSARDPIEVREVFYSAARELGQEIPTNAQARWTLAIMWAQAIVSGELTPYEGSRLIWVDAATELDYPQELMGFVGLASEWEDQPEFRVQYEEDMREEARKFLARHSNP
jgi:hypothetical protein